MDARENPQPSASVESSSTIEAGTNQADANQADANQADTNQADTNQPYVNHVEARTPWFDWYMDRLRNHSAVQPARDGTVYPCPCCGYKTLRERGGWDICPVCFWEDDGQDEHDKNTIRGGPNGSLSLTQARLNFRKFGACAEKHVPHVRPPLESEI